MFLFLKLVLAHLIADFILQFEELYRLKVKSRLGHFFHAAIHAIAMLVLALPYLKNPLLILYLVGLAVIHYYQDLLKYTLQHRDLKNIFWYFTVDQIVHVAWLGTAFFIPGSEVSPVPPTSVWCQLYTDNIWTLYAIVFITATFKGTYWLHALRRSFFRNTRPHHFITSFEVWHALIERSWVAACFLFMPAAPGLAASIPIGALRLFPGKLHSLTDFLLSWGYAAATGLLFRQWIQGL
jgi:hypothetical protein